MRGKEERDGGVGWVRERGGGDGGGGKEWERKGDDGRGRERR